MAGSDFDLELFRASLLTREIGRDLCHYRAVSSTNDVALAEAARGAGHGTVFLAEEQSAGRGRGGRSWEAPPGRALLFSVLLRPEVAPAEAPRLTVAAAVAVCSTLREGGLEEAGIKWPNDVLLPGGKVAGILSESRTRGAGIEALVVGIGINVNQEPGELVAGATSLKVETGMAVERARVLAEVLNRLEVACARTLSGRFAEVIEQWQSLSPLGRGHRVRIEDEAVRIEGVSDGLEPDGALRVRRDDGRIERVVSGSAFFD